MIEVNDICKPISIADHGLAASSSVSAAMIDVGMSFSRLASGASSRSACIQPARTAEAGAPVISTKNSTTGTPIPAASRRLVPHRITIMPSKIETCIPDTATIW